MPGSRVTCRHRSAAQQENRGPQVPHPSLRAAGAGRSCSPSTERSPRGAPSPASVSRTVAPVWRGGHVAAQGSASVLPELAREPRRQYQHLLEFTSGSRTTVVNLLESTPVMETYWRRQSLQRRDVSRITENELIDYFMRHTNGCCKQHSENNAVPTRSIR